MQDTYCVVGAGVIGSWTALHLRKAGKKTTLIEQFPIPHNRGSSHGGSRVFRMLGPSAAARPRTPDPAGALEVDFARAAVPPTPPTTTGDDDVSKLEYSMEKWLELERHCGQTLWTKTGLLNFGPQGLRRLAAMPSTLHPPTDGAPRCLRHHADDAYLAKYRGITRRAGYESAWLSAADIRHNFPTLRYPAEWGAATDPNGGILAAHACVTAVGPWVFAGPLPALRSLGLRPLPCCPPSPPLLSLRCECVVNVL